MASITVSPQPAQVAPSSFSTLRLTRRGRVVLFGLAFALIAVAALVGARSVMADSPTSPVEVTSVVVGQGDTLWSFASAMTEPGEDVRDILMEIVELNGMSSSTLAVGQTVLVPAS